MNTTRPAVLDACVLGDSAEHVTAFEHDSDVCWTVLLDISPSLMRF